MKSQKEPSSRGKMESPADELGLLISDADLEAIQSDLRHLQSPPRPVLSLWDWLLGFFKRPPERSPIPSDWDPKRLATILLTSPEEEWPLIIESMYKGRADVALPRVAATFQHLGAMPSGLAKRARCELFIHYPFDRHPHYETLLIQEMYAESPEDREELYACYNQLPELLRLRLVRLLDDDQLDCLLGSIHELLLGIDKKTRRRWLRQLSAQHIDQFLDRLTALWRQHPSLLQEVLTDLPDDSLDLFLEAAGKHYRVATLMKGEDPSVESLHDLAFKIMGEQVLSRLGEGATGQHSALALLGKIPIEYLERTLARTSPESVEIAKQLEALHSKLRRGDGSIKVLDPHTLDERIRAMKMKVDLPPPVDPLDADAESS